MSAALHASTRSARSAVLAIAATLAAAWPAGRVWAQAGTAAPAAVAPAASAASAASVASAAAPPPQSERIVITGSLREAALLEAPYAITSVSAEELRNAGPLINLSEALSRVPGLVAANRNNYAQDLQISARGFGARAGFGVRGVRLYADGIPATMPDGQGQAGHFDLAGAQRIEVLRGPFSALYGNSSGGVIALVTAPATEGRTELAADVGSFGLRQERLSVGMPLADGVADVKASLSHMELQGFRPQSAAQRTLAQVRVGLAGPQDQLTLLLSDQDQSAQDPLGLTRAQFDADPRQTTPQATQFDTRKTIGQVQAGLRWRHSFAEGALREASLAVYDGTRDVVQWLAIAPATQAPPRHGGGVIDFSRSYSGGDLRLRWAWASSLGSTDLAAGLVHERQSDLRRGYENFTGTGTGQLLGVTGRLRRDETNTADSREAYAQLTQQLSGSLQLSAGLRSGRVALATEDRYLSNGDDSGKLDYRFNNPVLGLRWTLTPRWMLYASAARGFESPTLGELAYRGDGGTGFNSGLRGQRSRQVEAGSKWRGDGVELDGALFDIRTQDEIGVQTNSGGRSSFQNVGRTHRYGLELAAAVGDPLGWRAQTAVTVLQARYVDGFFTCTAVPCTNATVPVPAGNRIAGTQRGNVWAELQTPATAWGRAAVEWRTAARTAASDLNTDFAPGQATFNLRWSKRFALGPGQALEALARVDNVADKAYVGSVIVNDANGRLYEPGAPRNGLVSLRFVQNW